MKPTEIQILHLSDLHFEDGVPRPVFEVLLRDVESLLKNAQMLVIVVTGDFISKAEFGKNAQNVKTFFARLRKALPKNCVQDVELVPGNHDFERPTIKNKHNKYSFKANFREYAKLAKSIYNVFDIPPKNRYGVSDIDYCGGKICFVRVDTSLILSKEELSAEVKGDIDINTTIQAKDAKLDEYDIVEKRFVNISKDIDAQKKIIAKGYSDLARKCHSGRPSLTIAVSHYPLSWLNDTGHKKLRETLFEKGLEFVDIWLCGHLHDAQLYYTNDDGKQTTMLMSGIGRKENPQDVQRYSIYSISPVRNVCSVQIRVFENNELSDKSRNVTLPLRTKKEVGAVIQMNRCNEKMPMGYYVDDPTLQLLKFVSGRMVEFDRKLHQLVDEYAGKKDSVRQFPEFLRVVSSSVLYYFSPTNLQGQISFPDFGLSNTGDVPSWRVHFRRYQPSSNRGAKQKHGADGKYVAICFNEGAKKPRPIPWKSLIGAAFSHKNRTLVASANRAECSSGSEWDEYLTSVPNIPENDHEVVTNEHRPLLTFGISVSGNDYECATLAFRTLYLLEYLDINSVISHRISEFLKRSNVDLFKCVRSIKC